jgi:hypothetical protein
MRSSTFEMSSEISCAVFSIDAREPRAGVGVRLHFRIVERVARRHDRRERRAQVMRDGGEQRIAQALGLHRDARRLGLVGPPRPLDGERDLAGERLQEMALLRQEQAAALGGLHGQHAQRLLRAVERQVLRGAAGRVSVPSPGRPAMVEYPLSDR